ncbi:uncharacterized protein RJT21DRAFT_26311 [Scheffersomyces amazonensis]|uniref:uncharacterized protein n=1 Tax=Scheffersomyces amazonensis TaxID=1078765 RepID=UPI00315DB68E
MAVPTIKTIEFNLSQYSTQLEALKIPSLESYTSNSSIRSSGSPYLLRFKLNQLSSNITNLYKSFQQGNFKNHKHYAELQTKFNHLVHDVIDENKYVVDSLISDFDKSNTPTTDTIDEINEINEISSTSTIIPTTTEQKDARHEDLNSLRQRLLTSKSSQLDESNKTNTSHLNDYHESIQSDIINELTELTASLKNSAYTLSSKILNDDLLILNETQETLVKNSNLFKVIDKDLNNYILNKTGGKISFWFLLKMSVIISIVFLFVIIFIKIIPKI